MTSTTVQPVRPALSAGMSSSRWSTRSLALVMLLVSSTLLGVAAWLTPDARGVGTHEHLGLPPCGFLAVTGMPCATCGMTTAFAHAAHGQLLTALRVQPAGALFCLGTAMATVLAAWSLITAMPLQPLLEWLWHPTRVLGLAAVVAAAWLYKIATVLFLASS